jgi:hypothetical protein
LLQCKQKPLQFTCPHVTPYPTLSLSALDAYERFTPQQVVCETIKEGEIRGAHGAVLVTIMGRVSAVTIAAAQYHHTPGRATDKEGKGKTGGGIMRPQ